MAASTVDPWRLIGAHYFSPFPLDIGNTARPDYYDNAWLTPTGEGGIHEAYGGFLRDRPKISGPRPKPGTTDQTKVADAVIECQQAQALGLDLWWFDCLSLNPASSRYTQLMWMVDACVETGFPMVPMIDCKTNTPANLTSSMAVSSLTPVYQAGVVKTINGRPLLSSFNGEAFNLTWWTEVMDGLEAAIGVRPRLILNFLNASDANMNTYAGIAEGYGRWGNSNPNNIDGVTDTRIAYAKSLGKKWCSPVRPIGEFRPKAKAFAESRGGFLGRIMWEKARGDQGDMIQIVTWNDYSENTQMNPSERTGDAMLQTIPYQMKWWRDGVAPTVTTDRLTMFNRRHLKDATATVEPAPRPTPILDGTSTALDIVDVEVYAKAAGNLSINGGAPVAVPAGFSSVSAPLTVGTPTATMTRSGFSLTVTSNVPVVASPEVYDFTYYATTATG